MDLSIIVPIYNVEEYLDECLSSIYKIDGVKKEVILVNDGSQDNSQKIIDKYKEKFKDETVVIVQENKGLSGARNSGLKKARGKYISFIDSDDYIEANEYTNLIKSCIDLDLDIAVGDMNYIKNNNIYITKQMYSRRKKLNSISMCEGLKYWEYSLERFSDSIRVEVVTNIYKKSFLDKYKIDFKERLLHEDTLFMFEVMMYAKRVKYIESIFYNYRMREGSIMKQESRKNYIHKLYIAEQLQLIKENKNISLYSWDTLILSLYFSAVKNYKIKNISLYNKIRFNKKLTLISRIKKILLVFYHKVSDEVKINI